MRNFTNTRIKSNKTKKKSRRLSFNLLRYRFNLAMFSCGINPSYHSSAQKLDVRMIRCLPFSIHILAHECRNIPLEPIPTGMMCELQGDTIREDTTLHAAVACLDCPGRVSSGEFTGCGGGTFDDTSNKGCGTRGCRCHRLQQKLAEAFAQHCQAH